MGKYRPNVCLLILNQQNQLFLGERLGSPGVWQLPQGGVEADLDLKANAIREAAEELGVNPESFEAIKLLEARNQYKWDEVPIYFQGKWIGQKQRFYLLRFLGKDSEIQLDRYEAEFSSWKWVMPKDAIKQSENKRKQGYKKAIEELMGFLKQESLSE